MKLVDSTYNLEEEIRFMPIGYGKSFHYSKSVQIIPYTILYDTNLTEQEWLQIRGKENRKVAPWTPNHEEEVSHAYFHYYSSAFDQPHIREAWASIPHILQIDDHDM